MAQLNFILMILLIKLHTNDIANKSVAFRFTESYCHIIHVQKKLQERLLMKKKTQRSCWVKKGKTNSCWEHFSNIKTPKRVSR